MICYFRFRSFIRATQAGRYFTLRFSFESCLKTALFPQLQPLALEDISLMRLMLRSTSECPRA